MQVNIFKNGFLWDSFEFKGVYDLQSKVQGEIENEMTVFSFHREINKIKKGGVFKFDLGTTIEIK